MSNQSTNSLWEQQQETLAQLQQEEPDAFRSKQLPSELLRKRIGILIDLPELPTGILRYHPTDFIVEEIRKDGNIVTVDHQNPGGPLMEGEGTIYADMVKVGLSTLDATARISEQLSLTQDQVKHAGIKDAVALTGQTISLRGTSLDAVQAFSDPNIWLSNIQEGKGVVEVGGLTGNRFTLLIRTPQSFDESVLAGQLEYVRKNGIMNYFGAQRFGGPHYLSHSYGLLLMRGDYEGCVRAYLSMQSEYEWPYIQSIRKQAGELFGDWKAIDALMAPLPHTFRFEREILEVLMQDNSSQRFERAIARVGQQANMWVRAYGSFLVNQLLSRAEMGTMELPDQLPLLTNQSEEARAIFEPILKEQRALEYQRHLRPFQAHIKSGRNPSMPIKIHPDIHDWKRIDEGVILCFSLPKGAYATTLLMYLFELVPSLPRPDWLLPDVIDTKRLVGMGSIAPALTELGPQLKKMREVREEREKNLSE